MDRNSSVKVLIVDDQATIVDELNEFLEGCGYRCVPCLSAREAIERFTEDASIGIVLCDLEMPGMNGIELVRMMKEIGARQHLFEAIMLTGRAEKKDVIDALRAGIADYYQKPVDLDELLAGVQRQEAALQERQSNMQRLGQLNDKLQFLAASINDLYQDLDKPRAPLVPKPSANDADRGEVLGTPDLFATLSPRQLAVARLVGKGQTNYQIACELGITENTVKLYVSQVLRLTHMHNRTQLALALSPGGIARNRLTEH